MRWKAPHAFLGFTQFSFIFYTPKPGFILGICLALQMILTPLSPIERRRALCALRQGLFAPPLADLQAWRVLEAIIASSPNALHQSEPTHYDTAYERDIARQFARTMGMGVLLGHHPQDGLSWDGVNLAGEMEAYVILHDVAHYQVAAPQRRRSADFGLGAGPETGARQKADAAQHLFGAPREMEEAMASLLGILWEVRLGQAALWAFFEQNWLENADNGRGSAHFCHVLTLLNRAGLLDTQSARPRQTLRQSADNDFWQAAF
jgi:hypothetical protein